MYVTHPIKILHPRAEHRCIYCGKKDKLPYMQWKTMDGGGISVSNAHVTCFEFMKRTCDGCHIGCTDGCDDPRECFSIECENHNYIFLDVDGVLNEHCEVPLIRECLENLASVVNETKANIIVSSSWREYPDMMEILKDALKGVGLSYYGWTEPNHGKGWAIDKFLEDHKRQIKKYVVIDDDYTLANYYDGHFVLCRSTFDDDAKNRTLALLDKIP